MNRADLIKLVSHQMQDEIEKARVGMLESCRAAELAFMEEVSRSALNTYSHRITELLQLTGGNKNRVKAVVHYELTDDELVTPRGCCTVTIRDGEQWDQTFEVTVSMLIKDESHRLREDWITFRIAYITARNADTRMSAVKPEAWKKVMDATLDNTDAGKAVKAACSELRKELKRDGFEAIAEKLGA